MISIDFGNSYTKVAIRPDPDPIRPDQIWTSNSVTDSRLTFDREQLKFCIPTIVARDPDGQLFHGVDVLQLPTEGTTVYRNWKPRFFRGVDGQIIGGGQQPTRPPQTVQAQESKAQGSETAIRDAYWGFIRDRVAAGDKDAVIKTSFEAFEEFWQYTQRNPAIASSQGAAAPPESSELDDYEALGTEYFRWLRGFVDSVCQVRGFPRADRTTARITLPSFGGEAAAKLKLKHILSDAGWRVDPVAPTLFEPQANYWGLVSEGRNAAWIPPLHNPERVLHPNLRLMLEGSRLWKRIITQGRL